MTLKRLVLLGIALFILGISLGLGELLRFSRTPFRPISETPVPKTLELTKGTSLHEFAAMLEKEEVISSAMRFVWWGKLTRQWNLVKAGEYDFSAAQTPKEIFSVLIRGLSKGYPLTIREGMNLYEIAQEMGEKKLAPTKKILSLCRDPAFIAGLWKQFDLSPPSPKTLEGYLFPDTYSFTKKMSPEDMVRSMVRRWSSVWSIQLEEESRAMGFTRHQIMTLASIIEKETGATQERPMVSSVFHNRLKQKMKLQSDPTTIYGIWDHYRGNLQRIHLLDHNPYNTYVIDALPVGPISNPGLASIEAAIHPTSSRALYFVSHNDGTHEFTETYASHLAAVQKFQLNAKARTGKSWRDLRHARENQKKSPGKNK